LYRGISNFKKGYQSRINIVKNDKSDLVADPYSIVAISPSYGMYMELMILGTQKCTQQNH